MRLVSRFSATRSTFGAFHASAARRHFVRQTSGAGHRDGLRTSSANFGALSLCRMRPQGELSHIRVLVLFLFNSSLHLYVLVSEYYNYIVYYNNYVIKSAHYFLVTLKNKRKWNDSFVRNVVC